jgi:hypothetical protein
MTKETRTTKLDNSKKDKYGNKLKRGDIVHDKWGYDLEVHYNYQMGWFGMLVCDENDSCKNIPYALNEDEITLVKTNRNKH